MRWPAATWCSFAVCRRGHRALALCASLATLSGTAAYVDRLLPDLRAGRAWLGHSDHGGAHPRQATTPISGGFLNGAEARIRRQAVRPGEVGHPPVGHRPGPDGPPRLRQSCGRFESAPQSALAGGMCLFQRLSARRAPPSLGVTLPTDRFSHPLGSPTNKRRAGNKRRCSHVRALK